MSEGNSTFELLRDIFRHQLGVYFGFADFNDVQMNLAVRHCGTLPQPLDISTFFPITTRRGMYRHACFLGGSLDNNAANARLRKLVEQVVTQLDIFVQRPE